MTERDRLLAIVVAAGHELGLFGRSAAELGLGPRARPLVDVLTASGALAHPPARGPAPPGSRLVAEIVRRDRPYDPATASFSERVDVRALTFYRMLSDGDGRPARELATRLAPIVGDVLDAGGGFGTNTAALLEAAPACRVTLLDRPAVVAGARKLLAAHGDRVRFVAGDLRDPLAVDGFALALLANVLHLHDAAGAAAIVRRVAAALGPGGVLAIKDVRIEPDRSGSLEALLFAVGCAVFEPSADVHDVRTIERWTEEAGLVSDGIVPFDSAPEAFLLRARRP